MKINMNAMALTAISLLTLTGCSQEASWDKALVCSGLEKTSPTNAVTIRPALPYRISVDVRQRHGQIQLKSLNAMPWKGSDDKLHFQSVFAGGWMAGQLDEASGAMNLIVERRLRIDGNEQAHRVIGEYACVAATGPMLKGRSNAPLI
jgi:hypothetical protein